jgi:hypothetical protein
MRDPQIWRKSKGQRGLQYGAQRLEYTLHARARCVIFVRMMIMMIVSGKGRMQTRLCSIFPLRPSPRWCLPFFRAGLHQIFAYDSYIFLLFAREKSCPSNKKIPIHTINPHNHSCALAYQVAQEIYHTSVPLVTTNTMALKCNLLIRRRTMVSEVQTCVARQQYANYLS